MATLAPTREIEVDQVERAKDSGRTPVVFVHGLWLLASSRDAWAEPFENAGFAPVAATWPGVRDSVAEAKAHPETVAGKSIATAADHHAALIGLLLIVSGGRGSTVPWAIAKASYEKQRRNENVTEIVELDGCGHAPTIDSGRRDVAETGLAFVRRFA